MIAGIYNNYLTTIKSTDITKYDTHKKSELRRVYNAILKKQKTSPLYKVELNDDVQKYAVDLKENARILKNTANSFSSDDSSSSFDKKIVYSDNEDIISAALVNDTIDTSDTEDITIEVYNLATPQINVGNYFSPESTGLEAGSYSFDISTSQFDYEFQFKINPEDSNQTIQNRISRLINKSNIGLTAQTAYNNSGQSSIIIQSNDTGTKGNNTLNFNITDSKDESTSGSVSFFGLDNIYREPENANFAINGINNSSSSNNFTINKTFDITLNGVSSNGESSKVGFKTDSSTIISNINVFLEKYNSFAELGQSEININSNGNKLSEDIESITERHRNTLESNGFIINDDNSISIDTALITQGINEDRLPEILDSINNFKNEINRKTSQILIDPMAYVNKKLITYPNPNNKINNNPYITSIYSGMMYNNYL